MPPFVAAIDPETDGKRPVSARLLVGVLAAIVTGATGSGAYVLETSMDKVDVTVKDLAENVSQIRKSQVRLCRQINELGAAIDVANSPGRPPAVSFQERQRGCDALNP